MDVTQFLAETTKCPKFSCLQIGLSELEIVNIRKVLTSTMTFKAIIIKTIIITNLVTKNNAIVSAIGTTKLHMYMFVQLYLPQR